MEPIWQWGLEVIRDFQTIRGPALDAFFRVVTAMGSEGFYLILLPLVFWCADFTLGVRLAFALLLSTYVNTGLKDLFAHPRPFVLDPSVQLQDAQGYGLPSGHAQLSLVVWGVIVDTLQRTWAWIAAILLTALIGLSRVYLGVHFPTSVLAGWALGALFLAAYLALGSRIGRWLERAGLGARLALAVGVPLGLLALHPVDDAVSSAATLMGMSVGVALLRRIAPFNAAGPLWQRAARFLVGAVGLLALYFGLKLVFPGEGEPLYFAMRAVRYAAVGLWAGLGAPWLFLRASLASSK